MLNDLQIHERNPDLDVRIMILDPKVGISDDELVSVKFLLQMGWTEESIGEEYPEYIRFKERLARI